MELDKYGKLCAYGDIRWVQYESFKFDFLKEVESKIRVVPENGFIKGNTLDGQFIYLHLAEPFDFKRKAVQFSTDAYIKGKSLEEQKCKGMRFTGGVLGLLFIPDKLELNLDNGKFIAQCQDDAFL